MTQAHRCNRCERIASYGDLSKLSVKARGPIEAYTQRQVEAGEWVATDAPVADGAPLCGGHA